MAYDPNIQTDAQGNTTVAGPALIGSGLGNNLLDPPSAAFPLILDDGEGITALQVTVGAAGVGGANINLGNVGATSGSTIRFYTSSSSPSDNLILFGNGDGNIGGIGANGTFFLKHGLAIFNHSAPSSQPVLATGAGHTVDDVIALLQSYGFCKQS